MRSLACLAQFGAALALSAVAGFAQAAGPARLIPLPEQSIYPDAVAPDALAFACADNADALTAFFAERRLAFDASLIRPWKGNAACHVYFEPTLKGFRASRDGARIRALYAPIHPLNFLAGSEMPGYNLDIVKSVLSRLPRPAIVRLGIAGGFDKDLWPAATERHFGGSPHDISVYASGTEEMHPWGQDQMKAGHVDGRLRVLAPRQLFEGRTEDAELTRPLLANLREQGFVQSKLAWEGGGLQFVASPQDPSKTIMLLGLRRYWGKDLTDPEYQFVLRTEFGADLVLDLSPTGVHTDYAVAFLPADNTALVAEIVRDNADLARAAAFTLLDTFDNQKPPEVRRLASLLAEWSGTLADRPLPITQALDAARSAVKAALPERESELDALVERYAAAHCPGNVNACFDAQEVMLRSDPELVRRASTFALAATAEARLRETLLGMIEDQVRPAASTVEPALDDAARQLSDWGFRIVRIPLLSSGGSLPVSYANSLLFDRRLFIPTMGLGRFEERLVEQLRSDLQGKYDIIPIDARRVLTLNGGLHCVFGIIRDNEP